jgi:hypothetical protein
VADNPGIGMQWFGDRELTVKTFTRPGTVLPSFVPPIIGFHREEEVGHNDGGELIPKGRISPRVNMPASYNTNKGILIEGFYDLFWKNRLHIIPTEFDAGNILSAVEGTFEIYNSGTKLGQHQVAVNTLTDLTSLGITITGGTVVFPYQLGLGQSEVYTYLISTEGTSVINDSYDVGFGNGVTLIHSITGSRILLFTFDPQEGFNETFEWLTDIIPKQDGSEQRISVRNIPRQTIDHVYLSDDPTILATMENTLYNRLPNQIALPYWKDFVSLTAIVTAGSAVLPVTTTTNRDFRVGLSLAIFDRDTGLFEVGTILSIATNQITLTSPLLQTWAAGLEVLPVLIGFVDTKHTQERFPKDVASLALSFESVTNKDFSDTAGFAVYKSTPVYDDPLLLESDTFSRDFDYGVETFQNPVGRDHQDTWRNGPGTTWKRFIASFKTLAEYTSLRNFIHSRRGRQVAFYIPTRQQDFIPANTNPGTPSQIDTAHTGYSQTFDIGHRIDIEIEYIDGVVDRREITSVILGTFQQLVLDSALSQEWSEANVARASYLLKFRFDIDAFQFVHNWHNNGFVSFTFKEVQG